jgi:hypothetical protein
MLVGCFIGSSSVADADVSVEEVFSDEEVLCEVLSAGFWEQLQINTAIMQNARTKQIKRFIINSPCIFDWFVCQKRGERPLNFERALRKRGKSF